MKCQWCVGALIALVGLVSPVCGQGRSEDPEALRQQIQALQEKLSGLERTGLEKRRVTQLGAARVREEEPQLVTRVYDLSDLFSLALPYPAIRTSDFTSKAIPTALFPAVADQSSATGASGAAAMGGMGWSWVAWVADISALKEARPRPSRASPRPPRPPLGRRAAWPRRGLPWMNSSTPSPARSLRTIGTPWAGRDRSPRWGTALIISTTERNHEQIAKLLDTLRQHWKTLRTISVEAHWLWLTEAQLAGLVGAESKTPAKADAARAFGLVDDKAWAATLEELQRKPDDRPLGYHAVLTCYNGQTVHCLSGGQSPIVIGLTPVVGGDGGGVGYQPEVSTVHQGAALQITPISSTSGRFVTLDVHSRVVRAEAARPAKGATQGVAVEGPAAVSAAVDRPMLMCQQLETTLRVPVDRRMLVGGMTYEIQPDLGEPNLYLFVKIAVQELRDDQPQAKADAKPPQPPATPLKR